MAERRFTTIRCENELQWLCRRHPLITASNSRSVCGEGFANESETALYVEKIGPPPTELYEPTEAQQFGLDMEDVIIKHFRERTGHKRVLRDRKPTLRLRAGYEWMAATLDAWFYEDYYLIPVECKNVGFYDAKGWADAPPLRVQIQVQHQLAVVGAPYGWVAALMGGNKLHIERIERDDDFIAALTEHLHNFLHCVRTRVAPTADASEATKRALLKLHPKDNGRMIMLPEMCGCLAQLIDERKSQIKELEGQQKLAENVMRKMIGDNLGAIFPDGTAYTWAHQTRKGYTKVVEPGETRVLLRKQKLSEGLRQLPKVNPTDPKLGLTDQEIFDMSDLLTGPEEDEPIPVTETITAPLLEDDE